MGIEFTEKCHRKFDIYKFRRNVKDPQSLKDEKRCSGCKMNLPNEKFYLTNKLDRLGNKIKYSRCKDCMSFDQYKINKRSKLKNSS